MSIFLRRRTARNPEPPTVAGLAAALQPRGWRPVEGTPFDGSLEDKVHDMSRAMYGVPHGMNTAQAGIRVGGTVFRDAWSTRIAGRDVVVANAWTDIETEVRYAPVEWHGAAVCGVALPTLLPLIEVQSRQLHPVVYARPTPTGDPEFDARFVSVAAPSGFPDVLTSEVRARMLARDDWSFVGERYWLGCVTKHGFRTADDVLERVDAVMAVVAALPASVVPAATDRSTEDLVARIEALTSLDEAMTFLQRLSPDDRRNLAASDSALAAFADVRTPQEAMGRLQALPPAQKMQVMGQFMRARDQRRR